MTEQELRQHRRCFTGHRPEKLDKPEADVIEGLKKEIHTATADGFRTFRLFWIWIYSKHLKSGQFDDRHTKVR